MNKNVIFSTVLALAVAMASTGCKHRPVGVTPIPNGNYGNVGEVGNVPPTLQGEQPVTTGMGGPGQPVPETGPFSLDNWNQDPNALAAYTIHFAYDSAVIRDSDQANLQSVAQALQSDASANLLIAGNCDERGTEEYNRALGERRADAAREALVAMGVDPSRLHTISYGKDQPVDPGHDEAAWAKNRRDDFILLHRKAGM